MNRSPQRHHDCDLDEPWLCKEYRYHESHSCTLSNVCIFNAEAFSSPGNEVFAARMAEHCGDYPFDCSYHRRLMDCRQRHCAAHNLCDPQLDGFEVCWIKSLLCYDQFCEPDLSALPTDYRLYDLCCHIEAIEHADTAHLGHPQQCIVVVAGFVVLIVIVVAVHEAVAILSRCSLRKWGGEGLLALSLRGRECAASLRTHCLCPTLSSLEWVAAQMVRRGRRWRRNLKQCHLRRNRMARCFVSLFDDYFAAAIAVPVLFASMTSMAATTTVTATAATSSATAKAKGLRAPPPQRDRREESPPAVAAAPSNHSDGRKRKKGKTKKRKKKKAKPKKEAARAQPLRSAPKKNKRDGGAEAVTESKPKEQAERSAVVSSSDCDSEVTPDPVSSAEAKGEDAASPSPIPMISCSHCNARNAEYLSFCDRCGKPLGGSAGDGPTKPPLFSRKRSLCWQCVDCGHLNGHKEAQCALCCSARERSKFSRKSTKTSKRKNSKRYDAAAQRRKQSSKKRKRSGGQSRKRSAERPSPAAAAEGAARSEHRNTLNPNAREFTLWSNQSSELNADRIDDGVHHHTERYNEWPPPMAPQLAPGAVSAEYVHWTTAARHSSSRSSLIPRLKRHVNDAIDCVAPPFSPQQFEGAPPPPDFGAIPPPLNASDLQRQLEDMEAAVSHELHTLDALFPGIKPVLSPHGASEVELTCNAIDCPLPRPLIMMTMHDDTI